jgi:hypothetical protein
MKSNTSWDRSPRNCEICNCIYTPNTYWQTTCSYKCSYTKQNNKNKRGQTNFKSCLRCNKFLIEKRANAIYCSRTCKSMDHTFKHRGNTRLVSTARRKEIYSRDKGACYVCNKELIFSKIELDHLIPVSRGGDSSPSNVAVSCRDCNRSRGSRIGIDQLRKIHELRSQI